MNKSRPTEEELRARVYQKLWLTIVKDKREPKRLGMILYASQIDTHYPKIHLEIAQELGDKIGEGIASRNLGNAFHRNREFEKAIDTDAF